MDYIKDFPDNQRIRLNDICVIYISENQRYTFKVAPEAQIQTKFGLIKSSDLLNHPYGVRFECKRGWILPLRLTPELWTQLLPHRTQILYQADISMILLQLDIKPGSVVVESGTGSGSLSHNIIRACKPSGFLHTFDVNESRVEEARKEFIDHGYGEFVKVTLRNICELGYGEDLEGKADACILDLPRTWDAIEHAYKVLKPTGSRLCTFSPCIEQVQNNVAKMKQLKLKDIVTVECLLRPYEVKVQKLRVWTDEILNGLVEVDKKRFQNLKSNLNSLKKAKISQEAGESNNDEISNHVENPPVIDDSYEYEDIKALEKALTDPKAQFSANLLPRKPQVYAKQFNESVSHSGYLTFASRRP